MEDIDMCQIYWYKTESKFVQREELRLARQDARELTGTRKSLEWSSEGEETISPQINREMKMSRCRTKRSRDMWYPWKKMDLMGDVFGNTIVLMKWKNHTREKCQETWSFWLAASRCQLRSSSCVWTCCTTSNTRDWKILESSRYK